MRKIRSVIPLIALVFTLACAQATTAQQPREQPDMTVDAATRIEVIDVVLKKLNDAYVFPEVAKKMEQAVRERAQKKEYDAITSASKFAQTLTTRLQEVSRDKHLRVNYSHDLIPPETQRREPSPEERERFQTFIKSINFGFEKVERLNGNVGYLDLRGFIEAMDMNIKDKIRMARGLTRSNRKLSVTPLRCRDRRRGHGSSGADSLDGYLGRVVTVN